MPVSIKFRGREVQTPWRRKLVVGIFLLLSPLYLAWLLISLFILMPISLVLAAILQPFLRLAGRRGTMRSDRPGHYAIKLDREAFRRR